jgi:hypothetical protein
MKVHIKHISESVARVEKWYDPKYRVWYVALFDMDRCQRGRAIDCATKEQAEQVEFEINRLFMHNDFVSVDWNKVEAARKEAGL